MARDKARMEDLREADWYSDRKVAPVPWRAARALGTAAIFSANATESVRICGNFLALAQRFFLPRLALKPSARPASRARPPAAPRARSRPRLSIPARRQGP